MSFSHNDLRVMDGEPRVSDVQLQEVLGYSRIGKLRDLINKHLEELGGYGEVFHQTGVKPHTTEIYGQTDAKIYDRGLLARTGPKPISSKGGRPTTTYYLNEQQAVLVCMFSRTPKAAEARRQIIEVFVAWRRGELGGRDQHPELIAKDPFDEVIERLCKTVAYLKNLREIDGSLLALAHLPIWPSGRRPPWWHDLEVRAFLYHNHRQMSIKQAAQLGHTMFGERCPRRSAIGTFWQRLDGLVGLNAPAAQPPQRLS